MSKTIAFIRARFLVIMDIIFTTLTILTGWILNFTPPDALNPTYQEQVSESLAYFLFILFIIGIMLMIIAWTMIICRKGKKAIIFYAFSIIIGYFSTFYFIWVVNGVEHIFGSLKLIVSGALIWHIHITDLEDKEEQKNESKAKPKEKDVSDQKAEETENEIRKQRIISKFHERKNLEAK